MKNKLRMTKHAFVATSAAVVVLLAGLGVAMAQNWNLAPRYGEVTLRTGFTPDPRDVSLTAGGPIRTTQGGCTAYVANNPDVRLSFTGGSLPLNLYVTSATDTTLLVNLPNGQWVCNDDGGSGTNPLINLPNPPTGRYDIFVGTYSSTPAPAVLHVSELAPRW